MLVLAYANRFGINFHQLGQRVLQAASYRDSASHRQVKIGELLPRDVRGGVDAGARFTHGYGEDVFDIFLAEEGANESIGLAGSSTVADRYGANMVLPQQGLKLGDSFSIAMLRRVQIENVVSQQLAGRIHDGNLAACAQARINTQDRDWPSGWSQQKVVEVVAKHLVCICI